MTYSRDIAAQYGAVQAIVYGRIEYWLERATRFIDGVPWVYKSATELADELGLSPGQVRRATSALCDVGLLKKAKHDAKKWRQVCFYSYGDNRKIDSAPSENGVALSGEILLPAASESLTKITPSITHKDYSHSPEPGSERESDFEETQAIAQQASPIEAIAVPVAAVDAPSEQPKPDPVGQSSALSFAKKKSKEFREWLIKLATRLDKRDPVSWAVVVARNPDPVILDQFQRFLSPPPIPEPVAPPSPTPEPPEPEQTQLARLLAKWSMAVPWVGKLRREVAAEIAANPQWGIVCRKDGPALLEF